MKTICSLVISADGLIAYPDGRSVSSDYNWQVFQREAHDHNNFIVGRRTFELATDALAQVKCDHKIIVSSRADLTIPPGFTVAATPQAALGHLKDKVEATYLVGGAGINTSFAAAGLIDELVLTVEPKVIGAGEHMFSSALNDVKLELLESEPLPDNRIRLSYRIAK
ncbi:MAG TPA: dihydrofolate reductase [Candidatus Saccharimonadia bacterium]|nr:dihydrofolate reductase [Candidatus Saccharimonadia bacterium]